MEKKEYEKMYRYEDTYWWYVAKRNFIQTFLASMRRLTRLTILDVGCGTGRNMQLLANYGTVTGIDASKDAVRLSKKRQLKRVYLGNAEHIPYKATRFNLVTLFDVLYHRHIHSDNHVLRECYRVLKRGGYVLITDCAFQQFFAPHDELNQTRHRYTKQELVEKTTLAGFTVLRSSYIFFLSFPLFLVERLLTRYHVLSTHDTETVLPSWLNACLIGLEKFENVLLRHMALPVGSSILILAQKK
ncbi:MAG: class I SAM-dependent methyltransferase [Microgenomates group bacterium]